MIVDEIYFTLSNICVLLKPNFLSFLSPLSIKRSNEKKYQKINLIPTVNSSYSLVREMHLSEKKQQKQV